MIEFNVPDMSCGHCVKAITQAIQAEDADARIDITLQAKRVAVETKLPRQRVEAVLAEAGYPVAI